MISLKDVHDYLIRVGVDPNTFAQNDSSSVYLSMDIMEYALRGLKNDCGDDLAEDQMKCLYQYRHFTGITDNDPFCVDKVLLYHNEIPFDGVQEVCLLKDILKHNRLTLEEIEGIFKEVGLGDYFSLYIKDALEEIYENQVKLSESHYLNNPISAITRLMEINVNLDLLRLHNLNSSTFNELNMFISRAYNINKEYHFIDNIFKYREEFNK